MSLSHLLTLARQAPEDPWAALPDDIASLRVRLVNAIKQQDEPWIAAALLGVLARARGGMAHRAYDEDAARELCRLVRAGVPDNKRWEEEAHDAMRGVAWLGKQWLQVDEVVDALRLGGKSSGKARDALVEYAKMVSMEDRTAILKLLLDAYPSCSQAVERDWITGVAQDLATLMTTNDDNNDMTDDNDGDDVDMTVVSSNSTSGSSSVLSMFAQHLCMRVADCTAPVRTSAVRWIAQQQPTGVVGFCEKLSLCKTTGYRGLACELAAELVRGSSSPSSSSPMPLLLLESVIARRCTDVSAVVRTAALKAAVTFLESHPDLLLYLAASPDGTPSGNDKAHNTLTCLIDAACTASTDEKPLVRRIAVRLIGLILVSSLTSSSTTFSSNQNNSSATTSTILLQETTIDCYFDAVECRTRDTSLSVRKSALETLDVIWNATMANPAHKHHHRVARAWVRGVLCAINDTEKTVNTTACALFQQGVMTRLASSQCEDPHDCVWSLLWWVRGDMSVNLENALNKCKNDKVWAHIVSACRKSLLNVKAGEREEKDDATTSYAMQRWGAWLLLSSCSSSSSSGAFTKSCSPQFCVEAWDCVRPLVSLDGDSEVEAKKSASTLQSRVLAVITIVAQGQKFDTATVGRLAEELLADVKTLERPALVVQSNIKALVTLCKVSMGSLDKVKAVVASWGNDLILTVCAPTLEATLRGEDRNSTKIRAALFLIGELAMIGVDVNEDASAASGRSSGWVDVPDCVVVMIQAIVSPELTLDTALSGSRVLVPQSTRAQAFLALGKMCLRDVSTAKRCVLLFVKELFVVGVVHHGGNNNTTDAGGEEAMHHDAVRCNVLIVLGDLCRRYTNVVEPHLEMISRCLGDPSVNVRKRAIVTLAGLVQEDYVKLRATLFYRFIGLLADSSCEIRDMAKFTLHQRFLVKDPGLFQLHFIGCLFALSGFPPPRHTAQNYIDPLLDCPELVRNLRDDGGNGGSGERRRACLIAMLVGMSDAQRLEACNKIRRDVLGGMLDGTVPLEGPDAPNAAAKMVVNDAFMLLQCEEAELTAAKTSATGGDGIDDGDENSGPASQEGESAMMTTGAAVGKATRKVLQALESKNILENVIPLLVSLHRVASREKSPVLKYVEEYLVVLNNKYPEEMKTGLAPHRDLVAQLEYVDEGMVIGGKSGGKKNGTLVAGAARHDGIGRGTQSDHDEEDIGGDGDDKIHKMDDETKMETHASSVVASKTQASRRIFSPAATPKVKKGKVSNIKKG